ncbi:MAG TPA: DUF58 domain-containing protein [Mobilitalea sp.]|nr:DUF58 domain-containing protein [Mobilitalea sp.]
MRINRWICALSIISSGVFASYYGGNISYALFYLTIMIPIVAFFYTVYVYFRFKLYQSMDSYLVVKGDWTLYSFVIANEDYITFRNVKVNFLKDKSTIEATNQTAEYSLLPNESERLETRIKCNYRGEYYVGVDSVEVTDFLYLFTITYPLGSKLKAVVLPRVVPLEQLGIAPAQIDVKNPLRFSNAAEEELDTELRKYNPGDSRKRVHWKATARLRELMSRKYHHKPKAEIALFMDLMKIKDDDLNVIISEDKIIESVLAIANYYALHGTPSQIIYEMGGKKMVNISSRDEFNAFYKACATIRFDSKLPVNDLIKERMLRGDEGIFYVAATHFLTKDIYLTGLKVIAEGNHICVLFISDDVSEETKNLIDSMRLAGIDVYRIMSEDEINEMLTKDVIQA